jgi:hypothetical protein
MSASTPFPKVEKMLKECAPGYVIRLATHSRVIHFGGKVYRTFPKFDPVENGHIRKLVRFLGINPCAAKHLPGVVNIEHSATEAATDDKPKVSLRGRTKGPKKR